VWTPGLCRPDLLAMWWVMMVAMIAARRGRRRCCFLFAAAVKPHAKGPRSSVRADRVLRRGIPYGLERDFSPRFATGLQWGLEQLDLLGPMMNRDQVLARRWKSWLAAGLLATDPRLRGRLPAATGRSPLSLS